MPAPHWLSRLDEFLRSSGLPIDSVVVHDEVVTVRALVEGQELRVELSPRERGGPCFARVGRHLLRYKAPKDLAPRLRPVLKAMIELLARFEPQVGAGTRGFHAMGGEFDDPSRELRTRFPFAFVERSGAGDGVETEILLRATQACNQRCPFCSAPPVSQATAESWAECLDFVCARFPGARLTLTGGEPTLRPAFLSELELALSRSEISAVQVQTNAVMLAREDRVARLPRDPRLTFFVSLHATDSEVYDRCTGTVGQLEDAIAGIRNLLRAGHQVTLNCVANRANLAHLEEYVDSIPALLAGAGTPRLHLSVLICPEGRPDAAQYLVRYSELGPALEAAAARAVRAGLPMEPLVSSTHASLPLCLVSEAQRAASRNRPELGDGETGYEDFGRSWVKADRCRSCVYTSSCLGLPAPYALRFGLDELSPVVAGSSSPGAAGARPRTQESRSASAARKRMLPVPESIERLRLPGPEVVCTRPWTTLEVTDPRESARQCCADWTGDKLGDVDSMTLREIWNGAGFAAARKAMGAGAGQKCLPVCPRLHDRQEHERRLQIIGGSERFVRNQLQIAEDIALRRSETTAMPLYLTLCPSTFCNASCVMCLHWREPRQDLPERVWDELPEFLPTLVRLTLLGGEPLANPRVWQLLREAGLEKYPDLAIDLITNGGLLTDRALGQIGASALGGVTVSLNAGTAEAYERVQLGLKFDQVIGNLDALLRFRDAHPRWFGVSVSCVVQPLTIDSMIEFGEIARARDLHIRLLPLTVPKIPELDFYGSPDEVRKVVEGLDRFEGWARNVNPSWIGEIDAARKAILGEHAGRSR